MKLLQVTPYPAYPPLVGGAHRMHGLVSAKRDSDEVNRFATAPLGYTREHGGSRVEIEENYVEYRYEHIINSVLGRVTGRGPNVYTSTLLRVLKPQQLVEWTNESDIILVETPWLYKCIDQLKYQETPIVFSSYDFTAELYSKLTRSTFGERLYQKGIDAERNAVKSADLIVTTSERDKQLYIDELGVDGPFHVAPSVTYRSNLNDIERTNGAVRSRHEISENALMSVFVGSKHWPNVTAVGAIAEMARSLGRSFQFVIIGKVCEEVDECEMPRNVHLLGYVDDLSEWYNAADLALNPITQGGGTNVKVIEYFSYELPVITTPFGARGIPANDGTHFIVADIDSFSETIAECREGKIDREAMGESARRLVDERLNWERVSEELLTEIRGLVA